MAVADQAATVVALAQRQLDRVVSPPARREAWDRTVDLAVRRPGAFSFLALLTALTLPPTLLFASFVLSALALSLAAALAGTLFCAAAALLLLVPALSAAAACAVGLWAWAAASFLAARWLARRAGVVEEVFPFGGDGAGAGAGADDGRGRGKDAGAALDSRVSGDAGKGGNEAGHKHNGVKSEL